MASVLLYLGILFTIAVPIKCAQGPLGGESQDPGNGGAFNLGITLVTTPLRVVVQRKTPVLLNCSYQTEDDKFKPLNYLWIKDGKAVEIDLSKPRPRFQLFPNGSLLLRPRRKKSKGGRSRKLDGLYMCIVTTDSGSLIARRVEVVVASIEKNFTKEPVSQEVPEGSIARFECDIRAKPKPYYEWNRNNGMPLRDDPRISILPFGVIQIRNVSVSDQGRYWCQAIPFLHSSQDRVADLRWKSSRTAQLTVLPGVHARPPRIVAPPRNANVKEGETAYLECLADAWPLPVVAWRKLTGKKGPVWPGHQMTNLVISKVVSEDAGTYECSASSGGKSVSANATLSVSVPPKLIQKGQSHHYPVLRTFSEYCNIQGGYPPPTVSWYQNGKLLNQSGLSYQITENDLLFRFFNAQHEDYGFYQCVANNTAGQVISTSFILLTTPVKSTGAPTPRDVSAKALSPDKVLLSWTLVKDVTDVEDAAIFIVVFQTEVGEDSPRKSRLCSQKDISNSPHYSCIMDDLWPYTTYIYNVQILLNSVAGLLSEGVEVTTLEDVPDALPSLSFSDLSPYEFNVSWTPLSPRNSRGRVIQYKVLYRKIEKKDVPKGVPKGVPKDVPKDVPTEITVAAPQTSFIIQGLKPLTEYEILVKAATKNGYADIKGPWKLHKTLQLTSEMSPHFDFIFVNMTSVMLQWQASSGNNANVKEYTVTFWPIKREAERKSKILSSKSTSYTLSGLDENSHYKVKLIAHTTGGLASPTTRDFQILDLMDKLIPTGLRRLRATTNSITIVWSPVAGFGLEYEVCVGQEEMDKICHIIDSNSYQLTEAKPLTSYEFKVRVLIQDWDGQFSSVLKTETKSKLPSSPVNLTVGLVKEGSVKLRWQQPSQPNGNITFYLIQYRKGGNPGGAIHWKDITVPVGADNTYQIDDLDSEEYLFKLRAQTIWGSGNYTSVQRFTPVCDDKMDNCKMVISHNPPDVTSRTSLTTIPIVLICGGIFVIILIFIMIFFFCRRRCIKNRDLDPNTSRAPIYSSANGHIPTVYTHTDTHGNHRPINGHIRQANVDTSNHEFMPMIQIDERDLPDSKGDSDTFVIPNGLRMNGFVKHYNYHNRHPALSPISKLQGDINSEEMRGLMSGDGIHTSLMMSSSLDDMDGSGGGGDGLLLHRGEDHSSEDSGTGSGRAPCAQFVGSRSNSNSQGLASPASSPGSCSSHDVSSNTLPRPCHNQHHSHHHHHRHLHDGHTSELSDGIRRWGDEIGGVRIDPSTGTVIDVTEFPQNHQGYAHHQQVQPLSTSVSATGVQLPGKDSEVVWVKGASRDDIVHGGGCNDNSIDREGDRDSGHGSEVKMNHNPTTDTEPTFGDIDSHCDDDDHVRHYLPSHTTSNSTIHSHDIGGKSSSSSNDNDFDNNVNSDNNCMVVSPGDSQQLSLPLPPPPPPPPPLSSPLPTIMSSSPSSSSSSQQLPSVTPTTTTPSSSRNRKLSNSKLPPSSSSSSRRMTNRLVNSSTSECDELPPPPPPPPVTTATPTPSHHAADDQGSSSTTPQGQLVGSHDGVIFSSSPSSSSTPHESGSQSKKWNPSSSIA